MTALPTIAPTEQLIFISSFVFGSFYFPKISAHSKSDTELHSKYYIHECIS